jgi:hypothetical protein
MDDVPTMATAVVATDAVTRVVVLTILTALFDDSARVQFVNSVDAKKKATEETSMVTASNNGKVLAVRQCTGRKVDDAQGPWLQDFGVVIGRATNGIRDRYKCSFQIAPRNQIFGLGA